MFQLRPRRSGGFCTNRGANHRFLIQRFQLRPRRSGGFCHLRVAQLCWIRWPVSIAAPPERGILLALSGQRSTGGRWFQLRPRRSGGFCGLLAGDGDGRPIVSIAAPPERGILREAPTARELRDLRFQLRPRRSGGFCLNFGYWFSPSNKELFQLRPRRSGGFCLSPGGSRQGR